MLYGYLNSTQLLLRTTLFQGSKELAAFRMRGFFFLVFLIHSTLSYSQLSTPTTDFDAEADFTSFFSTGQTVGLAPYASTGGLNNSGRINSGAISAAQVWTFFQPFSPTLPHWTTGAFLQGTYITSIGFTDALNPPESNGRPANAAVTAFRPHISIGGGDTNGGTLGFFNHTDNTLPDTHPVIYGVTGLGFTPAWRYWEMEVTYLGSSQYEVTARVYAANSNGTLSSATPIAEATEILLNPDLAAATDAYVFIGLASLDITSIDDFYTSTYVPPAMPVSWIDFTADQKGKGVHLNWSTATEQNTKDFLVQHSVDGIHWTVVGTKAAAVNSSAVQLYSFLHSSPAAGQNYYRLLQRDLDDKSNYSKIVTIDVRNSEQGLQIYPNPVVKNGILSVRLSEEASVQVYNSSGRMVLQHNFSAGVNSLQLQGLPPGMYTIKAGVEIARFIVQ